MITDLKMPRMDGFALITEIRKKQLHYIYTLVQTHRDDEETQVKALSLGADDFLKKPVRPVELCLRVAGGFRVQLEELIFFLTKLAALQSKETGRHLDRVYPFTKELARDIVANLPELGFTMAVAEEIAKDKGFWLPQRLTLPASFMLSTYWATPPEMCLATSAR